MIRVRTFFEFWFHLWILNSEITVIFTQEINGLFLPFLFFISWLNKVYRNTSVMPSLSAQMAVHTMKKLMNAFKSFRCYCSISFFFSWVWLWTALFTALFMLKMQWFVQHEYSIQHIYLVLPISEISLKILRFPWLTCWWHQFWKEKIALQLINSQGLLK